MKIYRALPLTHAPTECRPTHAPFTSGSDSPKAGAPGIEITPAMIEAGSEVVWRSFGDSIPWGSDSARGIATEVFQAMVRAARF